MIKNFVITLIFFLVGSITGCKTCGNGCNPCGANTSDAIHIAALNRTITTGNIPALRLKFLTETATLVGAQGGLAWRSEQINCVLKRQQAQLDDIYNFRALMLCDDVLPPVLEEGRSELTLEGCETLKTADQIYRIVADPCFVTAPPNWREYIMMKFCQPEQPDITLLPRNKEEAGVWNCYVNIGWQQGVDQANQIFNENLSRLKRDYNGMLLYRKLLAQNMVTPPCVYKTDLGVVGNERELRINAKELKIFEKSKLNPNSDTWVPVVANTGPEEVCTALRARPLSQPVRCTKLIRKKRISKRSCQSLR